MTEKVSRRKSRENALFALFEMSFGNTWEDIITHGKEEDEYSIDSYGQWLVGEYVKNAPSVDHEINSRLKGWTQERLPRVSLAVLRLAVTEMVYSPERMDSIVINEAVEISKKFGDENDYQFINGVLGSLSRRKDAENSGEQKEQEP